MENEDLILRLTDKEFTYKLLDTLLYNEYKEKFGHDIKTLKEDLNNDLVFEYSLKTRSNRIDILFISINNIQKNYTFFTKTISYEDYKKEEINKNHLLRFEKISYIRKKINNG